MNSRSIILTACGLAGAATIPATAWAASKATDKAAAPARKLNILFIQSDQLNTKAIGCYGGAVQTPNIDRLARDGAQFMQAYVTRPTSSPCRASIVTGLHTYQHGIVNNVLPKNQQGLTAADTTTDKLLNGAGYATHHYGKWHIGDEGKLPYFPDMYGYSDYIKENKKARTAMMSDDQGEWMEFKGIAFPVELALPIASRQAWFEKNWSKRSDFDSYSKIGRLRLDPNQWVDWVTCDKAIAMLDELKGSDKPFMITSSFIWPHDPNFAPMPYYGMFDPAKIPDPSTSAPDKLYQGDWSYQFAQGLGKDGVKEFMRIYYANVKYVDDLVGRLMAALERNGQLDNTMVIFVADHGDMLGNHGMVWKTTSSFYQDLVRVPMIIYCPKLIAAGKYDMPVSVVDFMPTILSITGHKELVPAGRPGLDLTRYVGKGAAAAAFPRKYVVCERVDNNAPGGARQVLPGASAGFMITDAHWKLVKDTKGNELLFDLKSDPDETRDLTSDPAMASKKQELRDALARELEQTGWSGGMEFLTKK